MSLKAEAQHSGSDVQPKTVLTAHCGSKAGCTKPLLQTGLSLEALNLEMPGLTLYESTNKSDDLMIDSTNI